jgi:large subunit ribosomal protein L10
LERHEKEAVVAQMKERLEKAEATFLVDYQGLDVTSMTTLRSALRGIDAELQVVKNRLLKRACEGTDTEAIVDHFQGPCALAISYEDVVAPAKVLVEQSKELKHLELKVGQINGKPMDLEAIKRLAKLPGREQLLSQVLSAMQGVPAGFVRVLNGMVVQLLNVLKAIENQKSESAS